MAATRNRQDAIRFHEAIAHQAREHPRTLLPRKRLGEFRPAFLSTISNLGQSFEPYDHEMTFVARALLYSHSVAVPDSFAHLATASERDLFCLRLGDQNIDDG